MLLKIWPQIAERYKDSGEHVLYEIMNEPHFKSGNLAVDASKWNKIQGNVLKTIRQIDSKHTIIIGAEDWNSVEELLKLPDYKDKNIILNFHDYSPFLFTTQGAEHAGLGELKHIPFPYVKEKMPPLPKNTADSAKFLYNNYPEWSKEENLVKPLDKAVDLANKRGVALMCNEFGVKVENVDETERVNWYKLKSKWMDERNIVRLSWDFRGDFGLFKNISSNPNEAKFPEDLNLEVVEVLGFSAPQEKS